MMEFNYQPLVFAPSLDDEKVQDKGGTCLSLCPSVNLKWRNISVVKNDKAILQQVSGNANAGELMAIMGPSGAGKTTLLNVLNGFTGQKVSGRILVDDFERDMRVFRKQSCSIMQEDHLLPHLTVWESVYLAARLKVPDSQNKSWVADQYIRFLGLSKVQNEKTSKLSGGERKRLSIAQEIISNPPLIFLDEPTSGLDSASSLQCMQLLKSLAERGHTVICTIHQPSPRIFEIFDKLYLLAEGQCIYRGPTTELMSFLIEQGLSCPENHNPMDFPIEVATGLHGDWNWRLKTAIDARVEQDKALTASSPTTPATLRLMEKPSSACAVLEDYYKSSFEGYPTSSWNQLKILTYRSVICTLREPMALQLRFLINACVALLLGALYQGIGNDASKVYYNSTMLFTSLLFLLFTAMMPTVLNFPLEKTTFAREYMNNWYSTEIYLLSKTLADLPFQIFFPVLYCSITYWMTSQPSDIWRFALYIISSIMVSLVAQSIGLLIGAATSVQNAVFLAPVISIPILLFSGYFISLQEITPYLRWLSYFSYTRYCYESVMLTIYSMDRPSLICLEEVCPFQEPKDFLTKMDMLDANLFVDFAAPVVFFFVVRIAAFYVLKYHVVYNL